MSSARMRFTSLSRRKALRVMSSKLPTGVGIRYKFDIVVHLYETKVINPCEKNILFLVGK